MRARIKMLRLFFCDNSPKEEFLKKAKEQKDKIARIAEKK